ncbi:MAG: hypothetical protein CEE43_00035 [Promethearchaeota archaeon Loki_b32]|nr:MAG: hypothetical protein CEE43_00035 [Candidatus Lokiarchaeota archaeon Loki_b32]
MNSRPFVSDLDDLRGDEGYLSESLSIIKNSYNVENPLISVVIPLYNEEFSIKDVIDRIPNHRLLEIIIVDDGSTDKGVKKVKEIKDMDIKIIKHEKNQGYGAALLSGIRHATGDIIVTMDSDGQHNPEEIPNLIKPIINNKADFVVGSRYLGKFNYKNPLYARAGAYFIRIFFRMLFLQRVHDNLSGFRAFKKEITKILGNMRYTGMGFTTELLYKVAFYQYKIVETPVYVNPRQYGISSINLIRALISISSCILYYILRKLTHKMQSLKSKFNFNQISKRAIKNFEMSDFKANVIPKNTYMWRERSKFIEEIESKRDYKIGINSNIRQPTIIYSGNRIKENFQTGHFVTIRENNKIGNNVSIGSHSNIEHHVIIEDNVRIHSNCFVPEFSILKHDCWLGPNVVLCNTRYPKSIDVKKNLVGPTIQEYAIIGANSTISSGVKVGRHALIGAGTVVVRDVQDYAIVTGNPGKKIGDVRNLNKYKEE